MKILTKQRETDWIAWIAGHASKTRFGRSEAEAIGNLVFSIRSELDIEIEQQ